jgi:hypothetical protein
MYTFDNLVEVGKMMDEQAAIGDYALQVTLNDGTKTIVFRGTEQECIKTVNELCGE